MCSIIPNLSPQVIAGVIFLILAMVAGYFFVLSSSADKKDDLMNLDPSEFLNGNEDKNSADPTEEDFKEYLAQEKKMEESPDVMSGATEQYEWTQSSRELDVYIPLDKDLKFKDISCKILSNSIMVTVRNEVVVSGDLFMNVVPSECNWQIDGDGDNRKIWISLYKAVPSVQGRYWRRVIKGAVDIANPEANKAPILKVDPNDAESLQSAINSVKGLRS